MNPLRRWWADRSALLTYQALGAAVRVVPGGVAHRAGDRLARIVAHRMMSDHAHYSIIERHLRRVNPSMSDGDLAAAVGDACASYARYWVETFRLPHLSWPTVERGVSDIGYQRIPDALEAGRGVILALPHLGGWEWAGRWLVGLGHELTVVVESLQPPAVHERFVRLRSELGMNVVPLGATTARTVSAALRANHVVCLLSDRNLGSGGVDVDFFGERTQLPGGPVALSLRTGAPVLPTAVYFTERPDGHHVSIGAPLRCERTDAGVRADMATGTQELAHRLEDLIRRAPVQWHLFQPNWPSDDGYQHG